MMSLDDVKDVDIDENGRFKYILIDVTHLESNKSKSVVRGYADCEYHADIFDKVKLLFVLIFMCFVYDMN